MGLGGRLQPQRKCGNGEVLDIRRDGAQPAKETPALMATPPPATRPETMHGNTGFGLRDTGVTK